MLKWPLWFIRVKIVDIQPTKPKPLHYLRLWTKSVLPFKHIVLLRLNIINNYFLTLTFIAVKSLRVAADFFL